MHQNKLGHPNSAARRWISRYYRGTFIAMAAIFTAVVAGALIINNFAQGRDDELGQLKSGMDRASGAHERLIKRRQKLEEAMKPVYDFKKAWDGARVPEKDAADSIRGNMESIAQKQLGLVTDTPLTPQPEVYKFEMLPIRLQRVTLRASGKDLTEILVWVGTVEAKYPLAAVELCELSSNVGGNTALTVRIAQPIGEAAFAARRLGQPIDAASFDQQCKDFKVEAINEIAWSRYMPDVLKAVVGIAQIRNPLQPAVVADQKVTVFNDQHDEIGSKLEQALSGHLRSVIRSADPFIVVEGRSIGIGNEVTIGSGRLLENLKTVLKEIGAKTLTFHISGVGANQGLEKDVLYNLPIFLQSR